MTKDRRLGRGLAALLGSPLDEDSIVDSAVHSASETATRATSSPNSVGQSLPRSSYPPPPASSSTKTVTPSVSPDSKTLTHNKATVTGSIPLSPATAVAQEVARQDLSLQLSVYEIDNNPFQPRRKFNEEEIASLAASIREHEQLQPILVRRVGERYQLISGERRLRAAIHAGLKTIRAEVREADDRLVAELAIVENLQRKDLDAIEKALSFRRYIDEHRCTQEDLAKRLKIDRSTIANLMRLLELPEQIQQWIQSDKVTAGHARALLPLGEEDQQMEFARLIQEEGWSVRETERRVSAQLAAEDDAEDPLKASYVKPSRKRFTPQVAALEQQMRLALGTKTEIRQNASGSGRITISFSNPDEFERLCALICPQVSQQRAA